MAKSTSKKRRKRKRKQKLAEVANKHDLYQKSVQNPEAELYLFTKLFRKRRRRKPLSMKEDFCGTAFLSSAWVKSNKRRTAIGIDLDQPTLDWGIEHNIAKLKPAARDRITLINADVLDITEPKVDITCALNFSYCIFKSRELLRRYFEAVFQGLNDDGVFFCELFGGTEAITELEEEREVDGFDYVWEQESYNPINHDILCHIHFDFDDGRLVPPDGGRGEPGRLARLPGGLQVVEAITVGSAHRQCSAPVPRPMALRRRLGEAALDHDRHERLWRRRRPHQHRDAARLETVDVIVTQRQPLSRPEAVGALEADLHNAAIGLLAELGAEVAGRRCAARSPVLAPVCRRLSRQRPGSGTLRLCRRRRLAALDLAMAVR